MNLHTATPPNKVDNFPRFAPVPADIKSHVCRYILARFDVSPSLANTIATLAMLGGAN